MGWSRIVKWASAHAAAFGGLFTAAYLAYNKQYEVAWVAFLAAMAGFGLNIPVGLQPNTKDRAGSLISQETTPPSLPPMAPGTNLPKSS
jgi:hypothetical protein